MLLHRTCSGGNSNLLINNPESSLRLRSDTTLAKNFDYVFGACHLVFTVLSEKLSKLNSERRNEHGELSKRDKLRYLWNHGDMAGIQSNVQRQAQALNLLLSALQAWVLFLFLFWSSRPLLTATQTMEDRGT
jgi:hypothetical protein